MTDALLCFAQGSHELGWEAAVQEQCTSNSGEERPRGQPLREAGVDEALRELVVPVLESLLRFRRQGGVVGERRHAREEVDRVAEGAEEDLPLGVSLVNEVQGLKEGRQDAFLLLVRGVDPIQVLLRVCEGIGEVPNRDSHQLRGTILKEGVEEHVEIVVAKQGRDTVRERLRQRLHEGQDGPSFRAFVHVVAEEDEGLVLAANPAVGRSVQINHATSLDPMPRAMEVGMQITHHEGLLYCFHAVGNQGIAALDSFGSCCLPSRAGSREKAS
mmetsp:Transcript_17635/g.38078  ORF Transcript_17635/g.38078 Transcript_17635/m.38078 type:complete len:272 (-) Transcript_17635:185-1000(-)